ncbi:MAG TPA: CdaR family protein [Candidatus Limnocylindrales bacterium]|jgi:YbbR domain-containing protein|nr:CdaR family protein [Candidatus Limnocylindrales bacterium]
MPRVLRFLVHNWPLKVAAIALATLLYGGLVLSQSSQPFTTPIPIQYANAPADVVVLSNPGSVTRIRYVAPPDLGFRVDSTTFAASIDLSKVVPTGGPVLVPVAVTTIDPRVQILDFEPRSVPVTIDRVGTKQVDIKAQLLPLPSGLDAGEPSVEQATATVTGPQSIVGTITEVRASVAVDSSGIDVNQLVTLVPIDDKGQAIPASTPIEVQPAQVRVRVAVFSDRRSKTIPVSPNVVGTPAAGFEIESVELNPAVVSVEGDANDLAGLDHADTAPVSVAGASSDFVQTVGLALPDGVEALGAGSVQVTIRLRPVTATRTFEAGLVLTGARSDRDYALSTDRVLVTIGGSVADLDRLTGTTIVLNVDVGGLGDGTHKVPVSANLQTGLTLVAASPGSVDVIVTPAPPASSPSPGPSPAT